MEIVRKELQEFADSEKAKILQRFFKTGSGQYGEGDVFLGVSVPKLRWIARKHWDRINMDEIEKMLRSNIHEKRLVALLILIELFKDNPKVVYNFYLRNLKGVNNWDLVDLSAPKIIGSYLLDKKDRGILDELASSENLWEKRIAIVSTFTFIQDGEFDDCLRIAKVLLKDKHDLIHKAVGWMLREVGKRDEDLLREFLARHYNEMSRTTLRYAIERFGEDLRIKYLKGDYERL